MTKETRALIEAAELMFSARFGSDPNQHVEAMLNLRAAISSAKAAEEGVEIDPAVKLLADVMHLWVDGYISKCPNSLAPDEISINTFEEIETFLATRKISVDYCGWHVED